MEENKTILELMNDLSEARDRLNKRLGNKFSYYEIHDETDVWWVKSEYDLSWWIEEPDDERVLDPEYGEELNNSRSCPCYFKDFGNYSVAVLRSCTGDGPYAVLLSNARNVEDKLEKSSLDL